MILSLPRPRCWRRPRVKWNGVTQSPACSWHFRPRPRTIRSLKSSEWANVVSRTTRTRMPRHEYHVFAHASSTVLTQHATNEIGLEIRLFDHGHALYELIRKHKQKQQQHVYTTYARHSTHTQNRIYTRTWIQLSLITRENKKKDASRTAPGIKVKKKKKPKKENMPG